MIVAGASLGIFAGSMVISAAAQGDIKRLADKYPTLAASEGVKAIIGGLPLVGGIINFFASPALDKAAESGMTPEDTAALERDHAIATWAPIAGFVALLIGVPVTLYLLWTDVIRGPTARQAAGTAGLVAAVPLSVVPTPAAQSVAPVVATASSEAVTPTPSPANPESGSKIPEEIRKAVGP